MSATPDSRLANPEQLIADLQRQLAECKAERDEAFEQQTATAEVLQVINSSSGDLKPVYDAILEKALWLCQAAFGVMRTYDGTCFRPVATRGLPSRYAEYLTMSLDQPGPDSPSQRIVDGENLLHVTDVTQEERYLSGHPYTRALVDLGGARSVIVVALRKDSILLGTITIYRQEARPFTDNQIALLQNFAAQAVIAMENARLITETREALEQQTATAEVLRTIANSPAEAERALDTIAQVTGRLFEASNVNIRRLDGNILRYAASFGASAADFRARVPEGPVDPNTLPGCAIIERRQISIDDVRDPAVLERFPTAALIGTSRSRVATPLLREGQAIGAIITARTAVRSFTEKELDQLKNFADQAVIAMENARLITETREALEQQTATAEVLQVINSSPGDLAPVFDAMLDRAMGLCEASHAHLFTFEGEPTHPVAVRGDPHFVDWLRQQGPHRSPPGSSVDRLRRGEPFVHVLDARKMPAYRADPLFRELIDRSGCRTAISVPLRKEDTVLGMIAVYRQEVRPFSDKQIALLENFAAQAVIAMENARLLTETLEALEQQTATAEVLKVISRSTFDLDAVLQTVVSAAHRLCQSDYSVIFRQQGDEYRWAAGHGISAEYEARERRAVIRPGTDTVIGRAVLAGHAVQIADAKADPLYQGEAENDARAMLGVPLLRDGVAIGGIGLARNRVESFTSKQVELVTTFADQAVIAMENARLIIETREALEQQTATAEVLQVINSSPGDLAPVFDAILEKAHTLCGAAHGSLQLYDGESLRAVATHAVSDEFAVILRQGYRAADSPASRALIGGKGFIQIADCAEIDHPVFRSAAELSGIRTVLFVPLRKDDAFLGLISAARLEVRPFTNKQIALLQNFAAQAVIAMDNARLLNEIRQRQAELRVTFDNMGDGVAMFDAELRLVAWNRNFQDLLDLPDTFLSERPSFGEYFRYLAARGEYGSADLEAELSRAVEDPGRDMRLERTRPDGHVIEVRRNAVPSGGFVLIYGDVTERKRAEEEIRAARDTAERALRELQAAQASLLHAQKMAALGQLTAGIAHEIKNPLNFVNNFAGLSVELLHELKGMVRPAIAALDENERAEVNEVVGMLTGNLEKIVEHGKRADGIVTSMLEHSRGSSDDRRSVDLNGLVEEALNLAYHGRRAQDQSFNVTLERDYAAEVAPIELVPQDITRVCLNLIGNGFYATTKRQREGGDAKFKPTLKVSTRDFGDAAEIRIRDNGIGIAPELRDKLFQPFFTTKPTGEGTGLGLSISWDIVTQQHGGTIAVDSTPGEFTEFTIRLSRTHLAAAEAAS